jgi:hypothetical protein
MNGRILGWDLSHLLVVRALEENDRTAQDPVIPPAGNLNLYCLHKNLNIKKLINFIFIVMYIYYLYDWSTLTCSHFNEKPCILYIYTKWFTNSVWFIYKNIIILTHLIDTIVSFFWNRITIITNFLQIEKKWSILWKSNLSCGAKSDTIRESPCIDDYC